VLGVADVATVAREHVAVGGHDARRNHSRPLMPTSVEFLKASIFDTVIGFSRFFGGITLRLAEHSTSTARSQHLSRGSGTRS
jgi:hypothetical protein